jgi:uncharacterized membrane protein (UPF0127 family)
LPSCISKLKHNQAMNFLLRTLSTAAFLAAMGPLMAQDQAQTGLPRTTLSAGFHQIEVQIASTPEQQATGLMHRAEMPQHEGMLFIFPEAKQQCFWMKNTLIPLTAAFIADDGTVVNLQDMQPQSAQSHCSAKPVRFVLEVNQGWFKKKGLKAGLRLAGPPFKTGG